MSRQKREPRLAICIKSDDPDLLTPRKIYEVLPDASAEKSNFIRVVDNEGEDYLYPASNFIFVSLPQEVEKALQHVSWWRRSGWIQRTMAVHIGRDRTDCDLNLIFGCRPLLV